MIRNKGEEVGQREIYGGDVRGVMSKGTEKRSEGEKGERENNRGGKTKEIRRRRKQ